MSDAEPRPILVAGAVARLRAGLGECNAACDLPRGAVGATAASGEARYGYPEIAGYWLSWAARRADVDAEAGTRVVHWLEQLHATHGGWPARIGDGVLEPEYRQTRYLFDHVMLWHGLRCWGQVRGSAQAATLAERVWEHAGQFVRAGRLLAARGAPGQRWSRRSGPFLLKVCARARAGEGPLAVACRDALPALVDAALTQAHAQAHPQLYAIEGLIGLGERAAALHALHGLITAHGGIARVREAIGGGPRRSDVLAQLLRAALLLDLARRDSPAWQALAEELACRVDAHGRIPFARAGDDCPSWAALFAEQALALWLGQSITTEELV